MKLLIACALTIVILGLFLKPAFSESPQALSPAGRLSSFAFNFYRQAAGGEENFVFSPYSISSAFAMTYAGARADTASQMASVLNFQNSAEKAANDFKNLERELKKISEGKQVELQSANALWAEKDYKFIPAYFDLVTANFGALLKYADFKNAAEQSRQEINAWVEEQTRRKIVDLIPERQLSGATRLALVNALYFKGKWSSPFENEATQEESFNVSPGNQIRVQMMNRTAYYRYFENASAQFLELPYRGEDISMIVILPKAQDGLRDLEQKIGAEMFSGLSGEEAISHVEVSLPRFTMRSSLNLAATLQALGMRDAFIFGKADFSGMDGTQQLFISAALHQAFIDVNEQGTEAAAATAIMMAEGAAMQLQKPIVFKADHPFMYVIRHNPTGLILFLGRVVKP